MGFGHMSTGKRAGSDCAMSHRLQIKEQHIQMRFISSPPEMSSLCAQRQLFGCLRFKITYR